MPKASLGRLGIAFEDIGQNQLKNIDHTVHIHRVLLDYVATAASRVGMWRGGFRLNISVSASFGLAVP